MNVQIEQRKNFAVQNYCGSHANNLSNLKHQFSMPNVSSEQMKIIDCLFIRLSAIYGPVWQSRFIDENYLQICKAEWADSLNGITTRQIGLALNCCKRTRVMPPSIPDFVQLCKSFVSFTNSLFVTQEKSNSEIAKKHLNQIKSFLKTSNETA